MVLRGVKKDATVRTTYAPHRVATRSVWSHPDKCGQSDTTSQGKALEVYAAE